MGKSSLNNQKRNGYWWIAVILAAIGFSAMLIALWATAPKKTNNKDTTVDATTMTAPMSAVMSDKTPTTTNTTDPGKLRSHIADLAEYYIDQRHSFQDQYWLTGTESFEDHINKVFAFSERLKVLLGMYSVTSETAGAIAIEFTDFNVSEYINGASKMLSMAPQGEQDPRSRCRRGWSNHGEHLSSPILGRDILLRH